MYVEAYETLSQEMLDKICFRLWLLFMIIFGNCRVIFCNFLLLDVSYSCDDDDNTKDCFELHISEAGSDPIDCNSAAVQNGTVQVVCYKIVFNFGLAAGASYGTFKIIMVALNAATSVILLSRKRKNVCRIRISLGILFMVLYAATIIFIFLSSLWKVTG